MSIINQTYDELRENTLVKIRSATRDGYLSAVEELKRELRRNETQRVVQLGAAKRTTGLSEVVWPGKFEE
jgi:hypothetical protein